MQNNCNKKILILANARMDGGLSGGDAIYESFVKYWPNCEFTVSEMRNIFFKPGWLCYITRIFLSFWRAVFDRKRYDIVYSSSDFLMDSIPAMIYKKKGNKWLAGFFLKAFRENKKHFYTQKYVYNIIRKYADMVVVTNPTMEPSFPHQPTTWINGGIELKHAGLTDGEKEYDAVFCGRFHTTKGIEELPYIWQIVRKNRPGARLAVIGDGDIGLPAIRKRVETMDWSPSGESGIDFFGYMEEERYEIFKKSKVVLYPTPYHFDHFSMAPVEAMACGCPMIAFETPVMRFFQDNMGLEGCALVNVVVIGYEIPSFAGAIINAIDGQWKEHVLTARNWAMKFDYEFQSLRVYNKVMGVLYSESIGDRFRWNVGESSQTDPKKI